MKLLIISDVHSNLRCLQAVMEREADCDAVYCAGDLVDVGLYPEETVTYLRHRGVVSVRGNHDDNVVDRYWGPPPAADQEWNFPMMNAWFLSRSSIDYLSALPERISFTADGVCYVMQHLYRDRDDIATLDEFLEFWGDAQSAADHSQRKVCIFGHSHIPSITAFRDDCWVINPGSVGYNRPKDPSIATRYITITDGEMALRDLEHPHCMWRPDLSKEFQRRYGNRRGIPEEVVDAQHPWLQYRRALPQ